MHHMSTTAESLQAQIADQSAALKTIKDKAELDDAKKKLGEMKKALAEMTIASRAKSDAPKRERLLLKTPKVRPKKKRNS